MFASCNRHPCHETSTLKRVLIFGNSGSGKSTLARELCQSEYLSHLDLDTLTWDASSARKPLSISVEEITQFVNSHDSWVIEGCYTDLLESVLPYATEIIYMNLPIHVCVKNARGRAWEPHKYPSKEAQDSNLEMLVNWISQYYERSDTFSQKSHQDLFNAHQGKKTMYVSNERNTKQLQATGLPKATLKHDSR